MKTADFVEQEVFPTRVGMVRKFADSRFTHSSTSSLNNIHQKTSTSASKLTTLNK